MPRTLRLGKKIALAAAAAALLWPLFVATPASAAIGIGPFECDRVSPSLCLADQSGHTNSGNPIVMQAPITTSAHAAQNILQYSDSICSGGYTVTSSCPFSNPSWDSHYSGDEIILLSFPNVGSGSPVTGNCVGAALSQLTAVLSVCDTQSDDWVVAPINRGAECALVNVYWMNQEYSTGDAYVLTGSETANAQAVIQTWNGGAVQEWYNTAMAPCA